MLYSGYLAGSWFDWNLLAFTAKSLPDWTIVLIGEHMEGMGEAVNIAQYKNVRFLGLKPQTSLPAYIHYVTLAFMPWKVDTISLGASPLKIYEYIAMRKMIVTPGLTQLTGFPNVLISTSAEDFVANIVAAASYSMNEKVLTKFVAENTWEHRVQSLVDATQNLDAWKAPKPYNSRRDSYFATETDDSLGFSIGTSENTTDVVDNATVAFDYSEDNATIVIDSDKDSIDFYFWSQYGVANFTGVFPYTFDNAVVTLALYGDASTGGTVSFDERKELNVEFTCVASGTVLVGFYFNLVTPGWNPSGPSADSKLEVYFYKECKVSTTVTTAEPTTETTSSTESVTTETKSTTASTTESSTSSASTTSPSTTSQAPTTETTTGSSSSLVLSFVAVVASLLLLC